MRGSRDDGVFSLGLRSLFCSLVSFLVAFDVSVPWYPFDLDVHASFFDERFDLVDRRDEDSLPRLFVGVVEAFDCGLAVRIYNALCERGRTVSRDVCGQFECCGFCGIYVVLFFRPQVLVSCL